MSRHWHVLLAIVALGASSCDLGQRRPQLELTGATMGTSYSIKLPSPPETLQVNLLEQDIVETLAQVEQLASTYSPESELSGFNTSESTSWYPVSSELCEAIDDALAVSRETDGAFDITVGPLVNLWGFGPGDVVFQPPTDEAIFNAMSNVGYTMLESDCSVPAIRKQKANLYVDLSGWAKGYAVDRVATRLDDYALTDYLVEIGGEVRLRGLNSENLTWAIAIEEPVGAGRSVQTVVRVADGAVATSGDYRNFFEYEGQRFSHAIDPRSGWPVSHSLASVTVIHPSCATADAMATALLVLGPESGPALAEHLGIAATFLLRGSDGIEQVSSSAFDRMSTS